MKTSENCGSESIEWKINLFFKVQIYVDWSVLPSNLFHFMSNTHKEYEEEERYYLSNNKTIIPNFSIYNLCRLNLATFFCILFLIFCFVIFFTIFAFFYKNEADHDLIQDITIDGHKRQYIIHLPKNYNKTISYPLVVVLHPFFTNVRNFKRKMLWDQTSNENQFISLYPLSYSRDRSIDFNPWNTELIISESFVDKVNDAFFIKKLVDIITFRFKIKIDQIFCTGHSDGGNICYKTAGEYPNLFYGIAPISSSIGGKIDEDYPLVVYRSPIYSVKLVHVHGMKDDIVKIEGGVENPPWNLKRIFVPLQRALDVFKISNGCYTNFVAEFSKNKRIELRNFHCKTEQNIQMYFLKESDHFWTSLNEEVESEDFKGKNLPTVIWNLLKK